MNPLWGLKHIGKRWRKHSRLRSQKHESSLGIETNWVACTTPQPNSSQKHESSLGIETFLEKSEMAGCMCSQKHESSLGIETSTARMPP